MNQFKLQTWDKTKFIIKYDKWKWILWQLLKSILTKVLLKLAFTLWLFICCHQWPLYVIHLAGKINLHYYYYSMKPHSLIFSFNLDHFGPMQNPSSLQEAIWRSDQNSKTTLIIKSTLETSFLIEKHQKNQNWNIALFTRFNLDIIDINRYNI